MRGATVTVVTSPGGKPGKPPGCWDGPQAATRRAAAMGRMRTGRRRAGVGMGYSGLDPRQSLGSQKACQQAIDYIHSRMFVKYEPAEKQKIDGTQDETGGFGNARAAAGCRRGRFPATGSDAHVPCRNCRRRGRDSRRGLLAFQGQGRAVPRHVRPRDAAAGRAVRARRRNRLDRAARDAARALRGRAATPRRGRAHAGRLRGDLPQDRDGGRTGRHGGVARVRAVPMPGPDRGHHQRGAPRKANWRTTSIPRSRRKGSTP